MNIKSLASANLNERWLVLANLVREVGMQAAYWVGIFGYAAYGFGGNPTIIAAVMLTFNASSMVGSVVGGMVVDRIGPRKTVLYSSLITIAVCVLAFTMEGSLAAFIVMVAIFGITTTVLHTAYMSFAPYLERTKVGLRRVNSFLTVGTFIAAIVGPAMGAVATDSFSVYSVFILMAVATAIGTGITMVVREIYSPNGNGDSDKADQAVAIVATGDIDETTVKAAESVQPTNSSAKEKSNPFAEALEGWYIIKQSRNLRFYLIASIAIVFGFGAFDALEPLYFKQVLEVELSWIGWINAVGGIGLIVGVALLVLIPARKINARLLVLLIPICGFATILYVGTTNLYFVVAGQLALGAVFGIFDPLLRTLIQADSPLEVSGRVLGTINTIMVGLLLIPLVAAPGLSNLFGVQEVLVSAGILTLVLGLLLFPMGKKLDADSGDSRNIEGVDIFGED
ncbi:MAG: MFS transporter [Coriobacteriia bacterium]|nr:MFS transporter [Coriobacteriia bacterium]